MLLKNITGVSRFNRNWSLLILFFILWGYSVHTNADFRVVSGNTLLASGNLNTSANLDLVIEGDPATALSKGIGLTIIVSTRLYRASLASLFFKISEWQDEYRIEYQALSNRYTLSQTKTEVTEDFATLKETLAAMEKYSRKSAIPTGVATKDILQMRLQVSLDRNDLPGPLKLVALIRRDWQLKSNWMKWKVNVQ